MLAKSCDAYLQEMSVDFSLKAVLLRVCAELSQTVNRSLTLKCHHLRCKGFLSNTHRTLGMTNMSVTGNLSVQDYHTE